MSASPELLVGGAGAAGLATAISAARQGARVTLVDRRQLLGGTVAHALLHTIGGLYDSGGEPLNPGLTSELEDRLKAADRRVGKRRMGRLWVLNVSPETYRAVVTDWIEELPSIRVVPTAELVGVDGDDSKGWMVTCRSREAELQVPADILVDCTGNAHLVRLLDERLTEADASEMLAGLIIRLRGVAQAALDFPAGVSLKRSMASAVASGELPAVCASGWWDTGIEEGEAYLKLSVSTSPSPEEIEEITTGLMRFLSRVPGFETAALDKVGDVTPRGGMRGLGRYRLTTADVRSLARFPDAACRCAWPIEYWDPIRGVTMEHLPENGSYDIPLRSLRVRGYDHVWMAGKCLSAEPLAQASARVAGCCWAMGEAVITGGLGRQ